ncbi:187-kDa microtubule-associated protein AIR9 isoform X1 [Helianthus annuus]|uniref:187-kDa microtubule-associated protein AIR9 isoform X1 n=1 Tax=Helianthus annuus TaxID=4232 RepID=UPI000B8FAF36|nr:187-kDa microtubule-associated protein AIR9 isoform X1 [Helianthus annuus]XP_022035557.1 187-kDa microtubule-associated protein AIR9 isoform X1 [Helianthus annuus]
MSEMEEKEGSLGKVPASENVKATTRSVIKPTVSSSLKSSGSSSGPTRKRIEPKIVSNVVKPSPSKPNTDHSLTTSNDASAIRRNSTGSSQEKQNSVKKPTSSASSATKEPLRRSLPEPRRSSLPSPAGKASGPSSPVVRTPRTMGSSVKLSSSPSSSSRVPTTSIDSIESSTERKSKSKSNLSSTTISSGSRSGSLSSSRERMSTASSLRKAVTPAFKVSRLIMLPQVETKAGDDVRLDLRGHRIRSLKASGLNLSPNLEFVYLRDNLLSSLEGIEILNRVKVLDLSFNEFKGPGFEPLEACKSLQQLYLAGNQITSLKSLPALPNLEFLSVAQNKLKSLSMASQPRLQVLAASKNKVSTLKGFPCLPSLEHLRLEENPILEMAHIEAASILLVGPSLKKFNDRDLSPKEIAIAKNYPAHTAVCIAGGWEFCSSKQALESTFNFLVEQWKDHFPPGYMLMEASVDQPFEEDACNCHFLFTKDKTLNEDSELVLNYQWFIGSTSLSNFTPIPDATAEVYWPKHDDVGKILRVECTPVLGDTSYSSIFAISSRVSRGTGCPKVLKLDVCGELVEGNILTGHPEIAWCGGTPAKGISSWLRRRWNSSPVVIVGAENEEYQLTLEDVDSCLVYMYTPVTDEGTKGEPQYAITDYIKPALPSVNNVQIVGDIIEGNTISGVGVYFGGKEGPSKFEWLRENKDTGDFVLVLTGTNEYILSKEDVGLRLAFVYLPVNLEGQEGKSTSALSPIVKRAPPKVTNLKISGDLKEGSKITVTANVTGATEGSSRVQWFKTFSSILDGENGLDALSTSKLAKAFRVPLGAVGYYIVAKFTPVNTDGESGEPAYVISDRAVETLPPNLNFLSITGDYTEGGILTASYGYIGGHEGKSIYNWYLHEVETDPGILIPEVSGCLQYNLTKDAIGKYISFRCTPLRDDGIMGESRTCMGQERIQPGNPRLLSLQVVGTAVEGTTIHVNKQYWGGEEGESVFRWFRTSSDGMQKEVPDAATSSYMLSADDIGFFVSVSCEPVRRDRARGPIVLSEQIGPIIPGPPTCQSLELHGSFVEGGRLTFTASYSGGGKGACFFEWFRVKDNGGKEKQHSDAEHLDLTLEDVGGCVELVYTPVREDGLKGCPKSIVSDPILPADPMGVELVIPDCCEDKIVIPHKTYFGGEEGDGKYIWYKCLSKIDASALMDISDSCEDVTTCAQTLTYTPSLEDVGAYLALYWVPTRADGKSGQPVVSICKNPVAPGFPVASRVSVKALSLYSYSGEGIYFGGYEGSSIFSWFRENMDGTIVPINGANSNIYEVTDEDYNCRLIFGYTPVRSDSVVGELKMSEPTDVILPELPRIETLALTGKAVEGEVLTAIEVIPKSDAQQNVWQKYKKHVRYQWYISSETGSTHFEPIQSQCSCSYKLQFNDIGCRFKCECVMIDSFGRSSEPAYSETAPVSPGIPRIEKMEIEGRGFHTNLYSVRGNYSGGKEGKSKIQWLRSMVGSPDLISIPGETGRMYEANVDDVGYRLVAIYTPIREDGFEGHPVSASTEPITVEPDVLKEVKQKLDLGSVKFEALYDKDKSSKKVSGAGGLERRILEVNRKRVKVVKPGSKTSFPTTEIRGSYTPPFHVETFGNDQHRLRIVVDSDNEVDLMVQTRHLRDVIVLVIRGFAQKFNSTSLNSLLKIDS